MSEQIPVGFIVLRSAEHDSDGTPLYISADAIVAIGASRYAFDGSCVHLCDGRGIDVKESMQEIARKMLVAQMRVRQIPVSE